MRNALPGDVRKPWDRGASTASCADLRRDGVRKAVGTRERAGSQAVLTGGTEKRGVLADPGPAPATFRGAPPTPDGRNFRVLTH